METLKQVESMNEKEELNSRDIIRILWKGKKTVFITASIISSIVLAVAIWLPDVYVSEAVLSPTQEQRGSNTLDAFSGIASTVGIDLGGNSSQTVDEAIVLLSSYKFFESNVFPFISLPELMAAKRWNHRNNRIILDKKKYLEDSDTWIRDVSFPKQIKPSIQEAHRTFASDHLGVSFDKETGFITISVSHYSPHIAKEWLEIVIENIDKNIREIHKKQSIRALEYLNEQVTQTNLAEINIALASLIQQEIERLMLIEVSDYYVLNVLAPPFVPELKTHPRRALICILGGIFGLILGGSIVMGRYFRESN